MINSWLCFSGVGLMFVVAFLSIRYYRSRLVQYKLWASLFKTLTIKLEWELSDRENRSPRLIDELIVYIDEIGEEEDEAFWEKKITSRQRKNTKGF